jgi:hypothetical protein
MTNNDPDPGWAWDPQGHKEWQQRQPNSHLGRDAIWLLGAASVGYLATNPRRRMTGTFKVLYFSDLVFSYDEGWTIESATEWIKQHPELCHEEGRENLAAQAAQQFAPPPPGSSQPKTRWWRRHA